ncbi:transcriptional regulator [candidate division KSB1 bacterium 4484_188]|nr:MAG: transcriptional regulator [candidate division KSB1 bacterium 4484_188]HFE64809.1 ArsR family transcriptional regulator [Caldithrix sp.]
MRKLIKVFKALSDTNRLRILKMLEIRSLCVCEITDVLQLATSTVSKHLSLLRDAELILDSKDGKWVNYTLNLSGQNSYVSSLLPLIRKWLPDNKVVLEDARKVQNVDRLHLCHG